MSANKHSSGETLTLETMFRVAGWKEEIEAVRVVKKTAHFVTYIDKTWDEKEFERKEAGDKFFPTWEAARDSLIESYETKIRYRKDELHGLESRLGQIRKMKP